MTNWGKLAWVVVIGLYGPPAAQAQQGAASRAECLGSHEKAQSLRLESKLIAARQSLRQCSSAACPSFVAADCVRWLEEVERLIPTVVFEAVADDKDVVNVKLTEGDRTIAESITGTPIEFDPGAHKFRAQTPGRLTQEGTYILREGEKGRVVRVAWNSPARAGGAPAEPTGPRPIPPATFLFGSAAVLAGGVGAGLGVLALKKRSEVDALHCKPVCTDAQVKPVKNFALFADVAFGVAAVSAGLATVFYITRPIVQQKDNDEKPPGPGVKPEAFVSPNQVGFGLEGSF